jgi:hypothetical protein
MRTAIVNEPRSLFVCPALGRIGRQMPTLLMMNVPSLSDSFSLGALSATDEEN